MGRIRRRLNMGGSSSGGLGGGGASGGLGGGGGSGGTGGSGSGTGGGGAAAKTKSYFSTRFPNADPITCVKNKDGDVCNLKLGEGYFSPIIYHKDDMYNATAPGYANRCNQCPQPLIGGDGADAANVLAACLERNFVIGLVYAPKNGAFIDTAIDTVKVHKLLYDIGSSLGEDGDHQADGTAAAVEGIISLNIFGPKAADPYYINDLYYAPASVACTDFTYYPAAFTKLSSPKNPPEPLVEAFLACRPAPYKLLNDSLGIAQGIVGIIVEVVLMVMMTVGGWYATKRRIERVDYDEAELEEVEETLKYALLAIRDKKKKYLKGEGAPLPTDNVLSKVWDELEELASAGGAAGLPVPNEKLDKVWSVDTKV